MFLQICGVTCGGCFAGCLGLWLKAKRKRPWVRGNDNFLAVLTELGLATFRMWQELPEEQVAEQLKKQRGTNMDVVEKDLLGKFIKSEFSEKVLTITDRSIRVRVFQPTNLTGGTPPPLILYYYDGGFVSSGVETSTLRLKYICSVLGAVAVSTHYELAPDYVFPHQFNACLDAAEYILRNPGSIEVEFDPTRVITHGFSAGGNFASGVALSLAEKGFNLCGHFVMHPMITPYQTDSKTEFARTGSLGWDGESDNWVWTKLLKGTGVETRDARISVLYATEAQLASISPGWVSAGLYDPLRDGGREYATKLRKAGKLIEYKEYPISHVSFTSVWKEQVDDMIVAAAKVLKQS